MTKDVNRFYLSKPVFVGAALLLTSVGTVFAAPSASGNGEPSFIVTSSQQAKHTVSGVIEDQLGPIAGANVVEKGTTNGTITDMDGKFTLDVSSNAVLVITYIGYVEQQIPVNNQKSFSILLKEDSQALEEVVVVGYGTQKKVNLTGSVATVDFAEQAATRPVTNVSTALAGLSAGVQVMQGSGNPGEDGAKIRIRGVGTLNNSDPLVIVDGMEGTMDAVNPQDIETISVLKDAASSAIYGSRAANGVILITTKRGSKDRLNVSYSGRMSLTRPTNVVDLVSDYSRYMQLVNESAINVGQESVFAQSTIDNWIAASKDPNGLTANGVPNSIAFPNTNWQEELFNKKIGHEHNISVSGGSDKITFMLSAGYLNNPGIVDNTGADRYTMRANVEAKVTKWLTLGTRTYATMQSKDAGDFKNANSYLMQSTPGLVGKYDGKFGFAEAAEESATANNPLKWLNMVDGSTIENRFNTTMYSKVEFMKGLSWDFNFNYVKRFDEVDNHSVPIDQYRFSTGEIAFPANALSSLTTYFKTYVDAKYVIENLLRYNTTIAKDHDLGILLGHNEYYYNEYTRDATKKGLMDASITTPGSATEMVSINGSSKDRSMRSFFGRINYGYKSRYLFEANLRYDGSSRFASGSRWGVFPSFSGAWRLSEEAFMENTRSLIDNLKIRASWGKLGNNGIGNDDLGEYDYQAAYSKVNYTFGNAQASGLAISKIANTALRWESTSVANFGVDLTMLDNRLSFEMDAYHKLTDGILYVPDIYLTMGNKKAPSKNIAEVTNNGVEFTLGWRDQVGKVNYSVSGNFAYNHNEVTKYKGALDRGWTTDSKGNKVYKSNIGDVSSGTEQRVVEGHQIKEYYVLDLHKGSGSNFNADGTPNPNGGPRDGMIRTEDDMKWAKAMVDAGHVFMPSQGIGKTKLWYGDYVYADRNGDGIYGNAGDNDFTGTSATPKFNFGLQLAASWNNFDLSMNFAGATGFDLYFNQYGYTRPTLLKGCGIGLDIANDHYFYNEGNNSLPYQNNLTAKYPRLKRDTDSQNSSASSAYLYKGDYLKMKNLSFGYTLPKQVTAKIFAQSIRFYFSAENLFTITGFPGQDPELGATPEYTSVRQFAFGTNITF